MNLWMFGQANPENGAIGGFWATAESLWSEPGTRGVLAATVLMGVVLGCALVPVCRRVWLAIKSDGIKQTGR